jgi:hypothetical protein
LKETDDVARGTEMTRKAAVLYNAVFFVAAMPCVVVFWYFKAYVNYSTWDMGEWMLTLIGYARFVLCPGVLVLGLALVRHYSAIASSHNSKVVKICIVVLMLAIAAIMFFNTLYTLFFEIVYMVKHF